MEGCADGSDQDQSLDLLLNEPRMLVEPHGQPAAVDFLWNAANGSPLTDVRESTSPVD